MPDNQPVDNGTLASYTVSSDLAASGQVQRVKLTQSGDGSDTHVTADANGLLIQGQVSLASSAVTASQAGSYNVIQGTSPWVVNTGGSVSVSGTTLASIVGSINNNPLNVLASQAGSWSVTTTPGTTTQNVNVASQSLSAVTVSSGSNTMNVNVASHTDSHTFNYNIASQSLSGVTLSTATLNVNLASRSTSAVEAVSVVGSTLVNQGPSTWKGTFKSSAGALGSHTTSAGGAGVKNYLEGFTYSYNASFISSNATTFQVKDGTVVIYEEAIANAGVASAVTGNKTVIFDAPLAGSAASPMTSTFSAVSAGTVEIISHWGYQGA